MNPHPFLSQEQPIPWSKLSPDHIIPDMKKALENAEAELKRIESISLEKADYEQIVLGLDRALEPLDNGWSRIQHLNSVANSPDFRLSYNEILPEISNFHSGICLREELWKRVKQADQHFPHDTMDSVHVRNMEETLRDFKDAGADLSEEAKTELKKIQSELVRLTQKFSENVMDSTDQWELYIQDRKKLRGLPPSALNAAQADAERNGRGTPENPVWRFSLQAPSYLPVLQYAEDDDLRKTVWQAASNIGAEDPYDNSSLIIQILQLRHEKMRLLGFSDFANYATYRRMIGSGENALAFVEDLHQKVSPRFQEEIKELEDFRAKRTQTSVRHLEPWELGYWSEQLRKERYGFDEEELRPYFPINKVKAGLFALVEKIFSVSIREREIPIEAKWAPTIQFFDLINEKNVLLGSFYSDWYPRTGKRDGAWMNPLQTGRPAANPLKPHLGVICGNMTVPQADQPSLLTHREVETIFHEFGHLLHHLCSTVSVRSLSGTSVAWDFVELPSQIMENWCWERESLDLFARHYETDEILPENLLDRMKRGRNFQSAMATMRQLSFAKMDLDLHRGQSLPQPDSLEEFVNHSLEGYRIPLATKAPSILRRFGHLFSSPSGYAAGYYSYKYAEVLDADAFSRFQKEGILNTATGKSFRETILATGNSRPPDRLFIDFMGRPPDTKALLRRAGLEKK